MQSAPVEQFGCWWCWGALPADPIRRRGRSFCSERCAASLPPDPDNQPVYEQEAML